MEHGTGADLAVAVREYLDLPVAVADTERAGRDPELHGLLKVVRANPGSESAVQDWATSSLPPERREAFATAWRDAVAAARTPLYATAKTGRQTVTATTRRHPGDTPAGAAGKAAGKAAEARVVAGRLDARPLAGPYKPTDIGNGERLAHKFGTGVRYCHPWGKWLYWDGRRWDRDRLGVLSRCAKRTARAIETEEMTLTDPDDADSTSSLRTWARKSEDYKRVTAMIRLAASEPGIPVLPEDLDTDPWLLNCQNCTLDLRRDATDPGTAAHQVRPDHQTLADGLRPRRAVPQLVSHAATRVRRQRAIDQVLAATLRPGADRRRRRADIADPVRHRPQRQVHAHRRHAGNAGRRLRN